MNQLLYYFLIFVFFSVCMISFLCLSSQRWGLAMFSYEQVNIERILICLKHEMLRRVSGSTLLRCGISTESDFVCLRKYPDFHTTIVSLTNLPDIAETTLVPLQLPLDNSLCRSCQRWSLLVHILHIRIADSQYRLASATSITVISSYNNY